MFWLFRTGNPDLFRVTRPWEVIMSIEVINPATGEKVKEYPEIPSGEVRAALERAQRAAVRWSDTPFSHRTGLLRRAAGLLREKSEEYARLMALEMGKPLKEGIAEAEKCAWVCDYYAENGEGFLADEVIETDASRSYAAFQPLGLVLAVMPWNFPFWQVFRFAAPALMAGNGGVLKHASNVPGCALAIEKIFVRAGFPVDLFKTLLIGSEQVGPVIDDPHVSAVTLTGSTSAGRAVAERAGRALKKTVLELGGSDPYLILEDADLDLTVKACVTSRLINGGQSCIAAKRFMVVSSVRDEFEARFVKRMEAAKMGDPTDPETDLGPLARKDLREELHLQVCKSVDMGAKVLAGGEVPKGPGAYYPPTVLTDVKPGMAAFDEELFGPVAAIVPVEDENEAVALANNSVFGLGAAVFTRDGARGERIAADRLQAGACFVNAFVRSDPRLPFGGIKASGYGRELGLFGIREFVNIKTVYIA